MVMGQHAQMFAGDLDSIAFTGSMMGRKAKEHQRYFEGRRDAMSDFACYLARVAREIIVKAEKEGSR